MDTLLEILDAAWWRLLSFIPYFMVGVVVFGYGAEWALRVFAPHIHKRYFGPGGNNTSHYDQ